MLAIGIRWRPGIGRTTRCGKHPEGVWGSQLERRAFIMRIQVNMVEGILDARAPLILKNQLSL
jgi:hypothetical protein